MSKQFTFFWDGPFSQWYPSMFEVNGLRFNCAEQYMMACKAKMFGDEDAFQRIMASQSPAEQKAIGRQVKGFDKDVWEKDAKRIVKEGNVAKFSQNYKLRMDLFRTKGTTLVEASPVDKIWGIGLAEDDPKAKDRKQWQGTNWLGEVITEVREEMLASDEWREEKSFVGFTGASG